MQLVNIIFTLISLFPNKLNNEKIFVDNLFNFDLKNKKVIITLKYKNRLNYYPEIKYVPNNNDINKAIAYKDNFRNDFSISNSNNIINSSKNMSSPFFHNEINQIKRDFSNNVIIDKSNLLNNKKKSCAICENNSNKFNDNSKDMFSVGLIQKISSFNPQNIFKSKNKIVQSHFMSNFNNIINPTIKIPLEKNNINKQINTNLNLISKNKNNEEEIIKHINFNFLGYFCFQKCYKNNLDVDLFNEASLFYKNQMDVINIFSIILLFKENVKKENRQVLNNILSEKIEFKLPSALENKYLNEE